MFYLMLWAEDIEAYGKSYRSKSEHHIVTNTPCHKLLERARHAKDITPIKIPKPQFIHFKKKGYQTKLLGYAPEPDGNGIVFLIQFEKGTKSIAFRLLSTANFADFNADSSGQACVDLIHRYYLVLVEDWFDSIWEMPAEIEKLYSHAVLAALTTPGERYWDFLIEHMKQEIEKEETWADRGIAWEKIRTKEPIALDIKAKKNRFKLALKKYLTKKLRISTILKNLVGSAKENPNLNGIKKAAESKIAEVQQNIVEKSKKKMRLEDFNQFCANLDNTAEVTVFIQNNILTNITITHRGQIWNDVCDLITEDEKKWVTQQWLAPDTNHLSVLHIDQGQYVKASVDEKKQKIQHYYQFARDKNEQFCDLGGIKKAVGHHNLGVIKQAYDALSQACDQEAKERAEKFKQFCEKLADGTAVTLTRHGINITNITITHNGQIFNDVCNLIANDEKNWVKDNWLDPSDDPFSKLKITDINAYKRSTVLQQRQQISAQYSMIQKHNINFIGLGGIKAAIGYHNLAILKQAYETLLEENKIIQARLQARLLAFNDFCKDLDNQVKIQTTIQGIMPIKITITYNNQTWHDVCDLMTDDEKKWFGKNWLNPKTHSLKILQITDKTAYKRLNNTQKVQLINEYYTLISQYNQEFIQLGGIERAVGYHNLSIAKQAKDQLLQECRAEQERIDKERENFQQFCKKLNNQVQVTVSSQSNQVKNITIIHNGQIFNNVCDLITDNEKNWVAVNWINPDRENLDIMQIQNLSEYKELTVAEKHQKINQKYAEIEHHYENVLLYSDGIQKAIKLHNLGIVKRARDALLKECDQEAKERPEKFKKFCDELNPTMNYRIVVTVTMQDNVATNIKVTYNNRTFPDVCDFITAEEKIWVENHWLDPHGDPLKILKITDENAYRNLNGAKKREYIHIKHQYQNDNTIGRYSDGIKKAVAFHNLRVLKKACDILLDECHKEERERKKIFEEFCEKLDDNTQVSIIEQDGIAKNITVQHNGQIFDDVCDFLPDYERNYLVTMNWLDPNERYFKLLKPEGQTYHVNEHEYKDYPTQRKRQHINSMYDCQMKKYDALIKRSSALGKAIGYHNLGVIKKAREALLQECDKEEQILAARIVDNANHYDILRENDKPRPVKHGLQFIEPLDAIWQYYQRQHQYKKQYWQNQKTLWPQHLHHIADHNLNKTDAALQGIKAELLSAIPTGTLGINTAVRHDSIDEDLQRLHTCYEQKLADFSVVYQTAEFFDIANTNKIKMQAEYDDCMEKAAKILAIKASTPEDILGMDSARQPQNMVDYIQHCKDHQTQIMTNLGQQNYAQHDAIQMVLTINLSKIDDAFNKLSMVWGIKNRLTPDDYKKIECIPGLIKTLKLRKQRANQCTQNWVTWHEIRNQWPGHFDFLTVTENDIQNEIDQIHARLAPLKAQKINLDNTNTTGMTNDEKLALDLEKATCLSHIEPLQWKIDQLQALKTIKQFEQDYMENAKTRLETLNPQYDLNMAFNELKEIYPDIYDTPGMQIAIENIRNFLKDPTKNLGLLDHFKGKNEEIKESINTYDTLAKLDALIHVLQNTIPQGSMEERKELGIVNKTKIIKQNIDTLLNGIKTLLPAFPADYRISYILGSIELQIIQLLKQKDIHKSIETYDRNVTMYQNAITEYFQQHTLPNFLMHAQRPGKEFSTDETNIFYTIRKKMPDETCQKIANKLFPQERATAILQQTRYYIDEQTDLDQHLADLKGMSVEYKLAIFQNMYDLFLSKCGDMYPGEDFNKTAGTNVLLKKHKYNLQNGYYPDKKLEDIKVVTDVFPYKMRGYDMQNKKEKILSLVQMLRVRDKVLESLDKDHQDFNISMPSPTTENYIKHLRGQGWAEEAVENKKLKMMNHISGNYIHLVPPGQRDGDVQRDRRLTDEEITACKETIFYLPERLLQAYMALCEKNNPQKLKQFFDLMDSHNHCMNAWANMASAGIQINLTDSQYRTYKSNKETIFDLDKVFTQATKIIGDLETCLNLQLEKEQYMERIYIYIKQRYAGKTLELPTHTIKLDNDDALEALRAEIEKRVDQLGIY